MSSKRGFTLIETMIATGILVSGLVAVAYMFSYSVQTNYTTQQMTSATMLVHDKLEELRATSFGTLASGGGLDGTNPTTNFREWVTIATNGAVTSSTAEVTTAGYLRLWQITGTNPLTITVVVFAQRSGVTGGQLELARASTSLTSSF